MPIVFDNYGYYDQHSSSEEYEDLDFDYKEIIKEDEIQNNLIDNILSKEVSDTNYDFLKWWSTCDIENIVKNKKFNNWKGDVDNCDFKWYEYLIETINGVMDYSDNEILNLHNTLKNNYYYVPKNYKPTIGNYGIVRWYSKTNSENSGNIEKN
jgi:hypothetical protein